MNIVIIPARGGSKRIPRKNILSFCGKPMIAYAIEAAQKTGLFEHIVVSTDDVEISSVARELGAQTPFTRPECLSGDFSTTREVIVHAIQECQQLGWHAEYVCCIYPCVPLIQADDITLALQRLQHSVSKFCFPIVEFPSPISRALRQNSDGTMTPFFAENELVRTQDVSTAFHDAGQFYWGATQSWLSSENVHSNGVGLELPAWRVVDIDTPNDLKRAEMIFSFLTQNSGFNVA